MKNKYIRLTTFISLIAILFLQGMWLYNTYKLVEADLIKETSRHFFTAIEKITSIQLNDTTKREIWDGKTISMDGLNLHDMRDNHKMIMMVRDFLYAENCPIPLNMLDSVFRGESKNRFRDYSYIVTDSLGNQKDFFNSINRDRQHDSRFTYKETIQLRNINPEYITLSFSSAYLSGSTVGLVIKKMSLTLLASVIVAIIVIYSLITQIMIIRKQDRIAKIRQDFTHAMVHDMKNPITSIIMGVNSLKSGKIDDKPQVKENYYSIITQESERILKLANKVLEIAQFEEQEAVLLKQQVNLSDLLERLKEIYVSNTSKNVNFNIELNNVVNIYANVHYIYEVFDNIIDNAVKYSKENEDINIYITSFYNKNSVQIVFKDTGIGISEKDQKKIFEKFERSLSVIENKKKTSGFGLGLSLVYQVIKAHGGTIDVNSQLNSFSEFIINLPNNNEYDKIIVD